MCLLASALEPTGPSKSSMRMWWAFLRCVRYNAALSQGADNIVEACSEIGAILGAFEAVLPSLPRFQP